MSRPKSSRRSNDNDSGELGELFDIDKSLVAALKHMDTFYQAPPPGLVKDSEEPRPEDAIPDLPQNRDARDFLAKAPSKGLWMPLGKEVKVMQCWKCKSYGHRSGDRECPLFLSGKREMEKFRYMHEDPMHAFVEQRKYEKKQERVQQLQALLTAPSSDEESSPSKKKKSKKSKKHKTAKREKTDKERKCAPESRSRREDGPKRPSRSRSRTKK